MKSKAKSTETTLIKVQLKFKGPHSNEMVKKWIKILQEHAPGIDPHPAVWDGDVQKGESRLIFGRKTEGMGL